MINYDNYELMFKMDLFCELGITEHPKREQLYSIAKRWSSNGSFESIHQIALDLAELIR